LADRWEVLRDASDGLLSAMHFYAGNPQEPVTAVLLSYADESGMHQNQKYPYVVLAGYFATEKQWKSVNRQWSMALRCYRLECFHTTDFFAAKIPPYSEWSENEANACLDKFVSIIVNHRLRGFSAQVSWDDYEELLSLPVKKKIVKHPYIALFDYTIRRLLDRLYWLPSELRTEKMAMFFGQTHLWSKADARYKAIKKTHVAGEFLVDPAVFADPKKKEFLPLQAADILANGTRSFVRNKYHNTEWSVEQENTLRRLASYHGVAFQRVTRDMLEKTERLHGEALARRKRS
jgi:Protein of unknown function (DUF3800)